MDDVEGMDVFQALHHLHKDFSGFILIKLPFTLDIATQIIPSQVFNDNMDSFGGLDGLKESDDTGAIQLFHDTDLLLYPSPMLGVLELALLIGLDGHLLTGELVPRNPHLGKRGHRWLHTAHV